MTDAVEERAYLSIGDVLALLKEEFPDVTISKIRFLESQGLLDPERIGVTLSEEFQLHPEQSTDALIVHPPEAKYFGQSVMAWMPMSPSSLNFAP